MVRRLMTPARKRRVCGERVSELESPPRLQRPSTMVSLSLPSAALLYLALAGRQGVEVGICATRHKAKKVPVMMSAGSAPPFIHPERLRTGTILIFTAAQRPRHLPKEVFLFLHQAKKQDLEVLEQPLRRRRKLL